MQLPIRKDSQGQDHVNLPWPAIATALITLISSVYSAYFVTNPQNEREISLKNDAQSLELKKFHLDEELKKQTQLLELQKFQSELLQSALQEENSKQRAQALRMLVDMKLLDAPSSLIDDFIKKPNTVPRLSPQSTGNQNPHQHLW